MKCKYCGKLMERKESHTLENYSGIKRVWICKNCNYGVKESIFIDKKRYLLEKEMKKKKR